MSGRCNVLRLQHGISHYTDRQPDCAPPPCCSLPFVTWARLRDCAGVAVLPVGAIAKPSTKVKVKVKVKVGKSLHRLNFPVLTSSFRPLFDLPDAPSAVPPTSSEWVPGRPVPKPWRF